VERPIVPTGSSVRELPGKLSGDERDVALLLDTGLVHIDELAARSGRPVSGLLALLSGLEIAGVVEQRPGRHFRRA
jgi:predicted Rossmann fold nucleotide-binding protein DprA/Smf involved in DNA uptake